MYKEHFLLDTSSAINYIRYKSDFFDENEELSCVEIGDGNINYVFKISSEKKSIILKQADVLLRSSKRPLDVKRSKIEAQILKIQSNYTDFVPKVYFYDEIMCIIAMQDISDYKNMREELIEGKMFKNFANQITDFFVDVFIPTTDLVMDRAIKKKNVADFINIEMCDISEDLVFTEPYYDYKNRNKVMDIDFVRKNLYENEELKSRVGFLRDRFMNYSQALIHGDLHTGSIFINQNSIRIIDPEFAFYGPIGYDIGNVIGNLYISMYANEFSEFKNSKFTSYLQNTIDEILNKLPIKFNKKLDSLVSLPVYNDNFKKLYINSIISDTLGYAGCEIIRRTVGDSKTKEISLIKNIKDKKSLEKKLVKKGIELIL